MQLLPLTLEVRDIKREQQSGAEQGYSPSAGSKQTFGQGAEFFLQREAGNV